MRAWSGEAASNPNAKSEVAPLRAPLFFECTERFRRLYRHENDAVSATGGTPPRRRKNLLPLTLTLSPSKGSRWGEGICVAMGRATSPLSPSSAARRGEGTGPPRRLFPFGSLATLCGSRNHSRATPESDRSRNTCKQPPSQPSRDPDHGMANPASSRDWSVGSMSRVNEKQRHPPVGWWMRPAQISDNFCPGRLLASPEYF